MVQVFIRLVASLWPAFVAGLAQVRVDSEVLLFTLAISVLTGLGCSLAPALNLSRSDIGATLKLAGRQVGSQERHRLCGALVVLEAASAVLLLIGSGLLIHSLLQVMRVPLGFSPEGVLIVRTTLNGQRYPSAEQRRATEREMVRRLAALPAVSAVALTTHIPLADQREIGFIVEGQDWKSVRWADNALVSGDYFAAMGIPVLEGRTFDVHRDTPKAPLTAAINEAMSRQLWPHGDAVGKQILWGGRKLRIVGIVGDVHVKALDSAVAPMIYTSVYQIESEATSSAVFIVRTRTSDPTSLTTAVRQTIWSVDHGLPVFDVRTMNQIVARSLTNRTFAVVLLSSFAILALTLAVIGLYGVLSYAVTQRTSELGVRLALGATPQRVLHLVLSDGLRLAALGVAIGVLLGTAAARAMSRLLFGIHMFDLAAFGVPIALLIAVALMASYVPARRASRVDPMTALRNE